MEAPDYSPADLVNLIELLKPQLVACMASAVLPNRNLVRAATVPNRRLVWACYR